MVYGFSLIEFIGMHGGYKYVSVVYLCRELDHLENIEDPYVTILPPSPSHFKSQHNSTTSLQLQRSASVPNTLDTDNNNILSTNLTADSSSMRSLYDDQSEAEMSHKPAQLAPTPPKDSESEFKIKRRNSFSEDHPILQRNTLLRETRKTHKRYASPQVTNTTFKIGAVDDPHVHSNCTFAIQKSVIHTEVSPTQSEASVGIVTVLQRSCVANCSPVALNINTDSRSSTQLKRFTAYRESHSDCTFTTFISPNSVQDNSFVFPESPARPMFTLTSGNNSPANKQIASNSTPVKQYSIMPSHQQSLPNLMACSELATTNPVAPANESDGFSPPTVKRFTKTHQRRKSLPDFMQLASVINPEHQKKLHKVLNTRPQSITAQQVELLLVLQPIFYYYTGCHSGAADRF